MKYRFTLLLLCFCSTLFSQTREVQGIVLDESTREPLAYATIAIYNQANLLGGTSTDKNGKFTIMVKKSFSHFEISYIGYKTKKVEASEVLSTKALIIGLEQDGASLDEVVVESKSLTTKTTIDRKIINLGSDMQQQGVNVLEAFDQIPEIQNDYATGTISLRGSDNIKVLVNGKLSPLNTSELLQQIPASNVKRIEIITSPSSKNLADGLSGIINVILKKNMDTGLNIKLNSNYGTRRYGLGFDGNYNTRKVNFRLNTRTNSLETINKQKIQREFSSGASETIFTPYKFDGSTSNISSGIDFFVNDRSEISFDFTYTDDSHTNNNESFYTNVSNREDYIFQRKDSHHHYINIFNVNYRLEFDKENHFLELDYYINSSKNDYPISDFEDFVQLNEQLLTEDFDLKSLAGDYTFLINKKVFVETGILRNTLALESSKDVTGFETNSIMRSRDIFDYHEELLGMYVSSKFSLGYFQFQTGLRYEFFSSKSQIRETDFKTSQRFSNVFPSLHISYPISEKSNVNFGYSKRVSRPDFHQINAFQIVNPLFNWEYNPNIKPEFSDNLDLSYQYSKKTLRLNGSLFYRHKKDAVLWVEFSENDQQIFRYINAGIFNFYGVEGSVQLELSSFWNSRLSANFYTTQIEQQQFVTWSKTYSSAFQFKNTFKISKQLGFDITYLYNPKRQNAFSYDRYRKRLDMAVRGKFLDKRLSMGLRIVDVFNENDFVRKSQTSNLFQVTDWSIQNLKRSFLLSVNYNLFDGDLKSRRRKQRTYKQIPRD